MYLDWGLHTEDVKLQRRTYSVSYWQQRHEDVGGRGTRGFVLGCRCCWLPSAVLHPVCGSHGFQLKLLQESMKYSRCRSMSFPDSGKLSIPLAGPSAAHVVPSSSRVRAPLWLRVPVPHAHEAAAARQPPAGVDLGSHDGYGPPVDAVWPQVRAILAVCVLIHGGGGCPSP